MGPSEKSFKQVKDILGKLDRSIDELRTRRSSPADPPSVAHAPLNGGAANGVGAGQGISSFTGLLGTGSSSSNGPRLATGSAPAYQNGATQSPAAPARPATSAEPATPQPAQPRKSQYGRATPLPPLAG